jgi:membrane protein required for colicin V production
MQIYDIIMLVILVSATIFGAWKGLAWQVASLAAIFFSYYVAVEYRDQLASNINATPPWNIFLAMLLLYVGTSFIIWLAFRLVAGFIDQVRLKAFDRQIGALFGFAKGIVLCIIITLFAMTLLGDEQRKTIVESRSGYYIAQLLDRAHGVMPSEVHDVLHPYIHAPLNRRLTDDRGGGSGPSDSHLIPIDQLFEARDHSGPATERR